MLTHDLLKPVLLAPADEGADQLIVVAGYVSATMAVRHLEGNSITKVGSLPPSVNLTLVSGMYASDGVSRLDHRIFQTLQSRYSRFRCLYIESQPSVHSKVYLWLRKGSPVKAFVGSANYSVGGFCGRTRECMVAVDPRDVADYAHSIVALGTPCDLVREVKHRPYRNDVSVEADRLDERLKDLPKVRLPLTKLGKDVEIHSKSGLNWGQRKANGRDREGNQAYIPVPSQVSKSEFFPLPGDYFLVATDDGESFECVIEQQNNKALTTPLSNSILGRYFRDRLGVPKGRFVELDDLKRYGRTWVDIYKVEDGTFFLDFRPSI